VFDEIMLQELTEKERARRVETRGEVGRVIFTDGITCIYAKSRWLYRN